MWKGNEEKQKEEGRMGEEGEKKEKCVESVNVYVNECVVMQQESGVVNVVCGAYVGFGFRLRVWNRKQSSELEEEGP